MIPLDKLRDQLHAALVALKAVMVNPVPAAEVFFVRDDFERAHVTGLCLAQDSFPSDARWESARYGRVVKLTDSCECLLFPTSFLTNYVAEVRNVLNSGGAPKIIWSYSHLTSLFSTFPTVFEAWERVHRLYLSVLVADTLLLESRAVRRSVAVSSLPAAGVCTLRCWVPASLEQFPSGGSAVVPWVELPEDAAANVWGTPEECVLLGVEGWLAPRTSALDMLIRESGSKEEAFAAFKLAEQLVP